MKLTTELHLINLCLDENKIVSGWIDVSGAYNEETASRFSCIEQCYHRDSLIGKKVVMKIKFMPNCKNMCGELITYYENSKLVKRN